MYTTEFPSSALFLNIYYIVFSLDQNLTKIFSPVFFKAVENQN